MIKEKHIVNGIYGGHQLARYIDVYEVSAIDCAATQYSGYKGTEVTLIDQTPAGYGFDHWNITGATLTGNNFILNNDVTAQATYSAVPHYTAKAFNSGTPFQGTTAYTGEYYGDNSVDLFRPLSRVSYDNTVRQEFPPLHWVNTAVNLEFTGNIFAFPPITSYHVSVNYNDLYNLRNNMTTFNRNGDYVTAGYMKLNASESAFITAVNIWVTGTTTNSTCNFDNLKINFNGQDLPTSAYAAGGGYACHLRTLNNGAVGKYVLPAPIVITDNDQKLTFYITGTVPQIGHTISGIAPHTAEWYGYISGLE